MTSGTHFRACNLCEAMCGIRIEVEDGRVASIRPDEDDPLSRGYMCPKAVALKELHEDPDRLRHPIRRTKSGWERMTWDDALDYAASGIHDVQKKHGRNAVGVYLGNPNVHNTGALLFGIDFVHTLRTKNRFSATSVDQLPHMLASYWMFGHQLLIPIPDLDRTQYFLVFGANPLASNGSMMTAPGMKRRIDDIRARGGKVVVFDPRRTETAERADEHVFVRPGTDALVLLAMLHVILEDGATLDRLASFTDGLEPLRAAVRDASPERVAPHTGVAADVVRRLAKEFASATSAVCYGRVGVSMQAFGTLCQWLVNALNIVTGNLDRPGGAMFPKPALDPRTLPKGVGVSRGSFGRWKSRVRGLPEFGGELPVSTLGEEILTEGPGRIRAMVTIAGNPILSTPNGKRLDDAFASLEHAVSIDPYLNETTRHASVILPPPSALERPHYDIIFHMFAVRETARFGPAVFDKPADARHDWEILLGLSRRLGELRSGKSVRRTLKYRALEKLGPEGLLDLGLRAGPHGARLWPPRVGLDLKKVGASVHGIDLGPLTSSFPAMLGHRDKRIQLAPEPVLADLVRLWKTVAETPAVSAERPSELLLVGRRHLRDNNSWMHNVPQLMRGKRRCTLFVHPSDATRLGLTNDADALVRSRVGEVRVPVAITDEIMPGVVSLPHGYGHGRSGVKLGVATANAGVSINDLSDDLRVDELSGNAAFSGQIVDVSPAGPAIGETLPGTASPAA